MGHFDGELRSHRRTDLRRRLTQGHRLFQLPSTSSEGSDQDPATHLKGHLWTGACRPVLRGVAIRHMLSPFCGGTTGQVEDGNPHFCFAPAARSDARSPAHGWPDNGS